MDIPPIGRQLLVAGSTHLAALSVGGVVAYPGVLLQQFKSNDTIIHLNLDNGSWIGSVHGLAGIPSFLMPFLMQHKGRKFSFILTCIIIAIGWICTYAAQSITLLIIGECFHGLGGHSLLTLGLLTISETVIPKYRDMCLLYYGTCQAFGMTLVGILGRYLHWKTAGLIMSCPIYIAILLGFIWPESPAWLAYKGRLEECEVAFKKLRGTDKDSMKELHALLNAQNENDEITSRKSYRISDFLKTITSRDFYKPTLHMCVLLSIFYYGGGSVVIIYSSDITIKLTGIRNDDIKFVIDLTFFIGFKLTILLTKYFSGKKVLLCSMFCSSIFMILTAIITYLQSLNVIAKDSMLGAYSLITFAIIFCTGSGGLGFTMATELMPVKHRGIGGCLFIILSGLFHSSSLKSFPYLCFYINIWGTFTIYTVYLILAGFYVLIYVPDVRNKTLQEIEEYYNTGYFKDNGKACERFLKNEASLPP